MTDKHETLQEMRDSENKYSSITETKAHINRVRLYLIKVINELMWRAFYHDASKMESPELEIFNVYTPKLKGMTYGSDEYKQCLAEMTPALKHHYEVNSHHPECYVHGIRGMDLMDIIEMFCDWLAATERHEDGDIFKSIEINAVRFGYDEVLKGIFENTAIRFGKGNYEKRHERIKEIAHLYAKED